MRYSNIPALGSTCTTTDFTTDLVTPVASSKCVPTSGTLKVTVEFPIFAITVMNFCGWIMLMIFLPLGQWSLFFDNFFTFFHRPRPMKEDEFNRKKAELAKKVQALLAKGKKLIEDKKQFPELKTGWFSRWRIKRTINSDLHLFETNCMLAEKEFYEMDRIASYNTLVDPFYYTFIIIVAVLNLGLTIWFMVFTFENAAFKEVLKPFMDGYLVEIADSAVSFFATLLLIFTGIYFLYSAFKGNVKLGMRFFVVTFYPLVPKETFVNAFMANCLIMNLWMVALTNYMCLMFKYYLVGTNIARIFNVLVWNMEFFGWFLQKNFWIIFMIVWWFISFVYFLLKPFEKINLGNAVKRADLAAKH